MLTIRNLRLFIVVICIVILSIGCGASKAVKQKQALMEIQKPVLMEKTGKDNKQNSAQPEYRPVQVVGLRLIRQIMCLSKAIQQGDRNQDDARQGKVPSEPAC